MTMPHHVPNPDRPEGMSVREYQMLKRFPKGSYARIKHGFDHPILRGSIVQIVEALTDHPMRFRVLGHPFHAHPHECAVGFCLRDIKMSQLVEVNPLEVLAEASRE